MADFFGASYPLDSAPATQGAARIREVKSIANYGLSQLFSALTESSHTFLSKWVLGEQLVDRLFSAVHLKTGSVGTEVLANGVLTADTAGRAKMADGFVTAAKLAAAPLEGATEKEVLAGADQVLISDSAAGGALKRVAVSKFLETGRVQITEHLLVTVSEGAATEVVGNNLTVLRSAAGKFRFNFLRAHTDAGYGVVAFVQTPEEVWPQYPVVRGKDYSGFDVWCMQYWAAADPVSIQVVVF